ncbi:uroporphyrinogen-III synthase [Microvirga rosea]|nr:uroporphyrinogen-III synthase [Microvirga rosea]MCB8819042.1 uroporphyrinogen-III synthase [Microvirga rosea]
MRVLVTRAAEDAARTASRLESLGHETILAPITRIVSTDEPQPKGAWDGLIVTSAHAEGALRTVMGKSIPVFAVGDRTATIVRAAGFESVFVAEGDAVSLSRLVRERFASGQSLLHVTARHHKEEPAASLRAQGLHVTLWEAYEARALETLPSPAADALRSGQAQAVLHYSRRSADLFLRLTKEADLLPTLSSVHHACLSADVAASLEALGLPVRIAARPEEEALLATLR